MGGVQIAPGISGIPIGKRAEAVPEGLRVALTLGLWGNGHLRTLGGRRALELLTNGLHLTLGRSITNFFFGNRVRTVLTEEFTGVISKDIRIGQDGFICLVLARQLLKQVNSFNKLLIGLNQGILKLTGVVIKNRRSIGAKIINNFKTCFAYPVCQELVPADLLRSWGRDVGVGLVAVDPRRIGLRRRVAVLGSQLGTVVGLLGLLGPD